MQLFPTTKCSNAIWTDTISDKYSIALFHNLVYCILRHTPIYLSKVTLKYLDGRNVAYYVLEQNLFMWKETVIEWGTTGLYIKAKLFSDHVVLCTRLPGYGRAGDYLSDSGHSEISSRSSLVSTSSLDMGPDDRRHRYGVIAGEAHGSSHRLERRATADPDQYSLG